MNYFHFYVGADSPIKSMDEVFGEKKKLRMAITQAGSSDVWVFERVLEAYGTSIPDLEKAGFHFARGDYSFQANQFKDKNVDAVFTFLALPGAAVTEASVGRPLKIIDFKKPGHKRILHIVGAIGNKISHIAYLSFQRWLAILSVFTRFSGEIVSGAVAGQALPGGPSQV